MTVKKGLTDEKRSLMDFFGAWPGSDEEALRIKSELEHKLFKTRKVTI